MKVRWLKRGVASLLAIDQFISAENPTASARIVDRIESAVGRLAEFPHMGRAGVVPGTRELMVPGTRFIVIYVVGDEDVRILRVYHSKQLAL